MSASSKKRKVYLTEAELPKKPKVSVLAPDGKRRAEISYYEVHDYPALGRLDVATIWETKTPEVQLEIFNAALWYGFTGQKPKVSPEAMASLDKLIEPIKKSRSAARKAKIKAALEEQALGGRIEIDADDDTGVDVTTGEVQEPTQTQEEPTASTPPPSPSKPATVEAPQQSPTPTSSTSPRPTPPPGYEYDSYNGNWKNPYTGEVWPKDEDDNDLPF